jgi:hypothetical protein
MGSTMSGFGILPRPGIALSRHNCSICQREGIRTWDRGSLILPQNCAARNDMHPPFLCHLRTLDLSFAVSNSKDYKRHISTF